MPKRRDRAPYRKVGVEIKPLGATGGHDARNLECAVAAGCFYPFVSANGVLYRWAN